MPVNKYFKHFKLQLLCFWLVVFLVNLGPEWQKFSSIREALEVSSLATILQWLVALFSIKILVPRFLNKNKVAFFGLSMAMLLFVAAQLYILVSYLYLEPSYPNNYGHLYQTKLAHYSLAQRLGFSGLIKYIILSKIPMLFFPAAILISVNFYNQQKQLLKIQQQKQAAELTALKNQLNPHFIFNTLNNIYSLAIQGSKDTAEAIAKLSGIFDYVLYQCNDKYVSLQQEVKMLENYIALEKLRFGDRVNVSLTVDNHSHTKIAPLLVLTLIENAFKHGVSQELTLAEVNIRLSETDESIIFYIQNSKPSNSPPSVNKKAIGLDNLKQQLQLLYPNAHRLTFSENKSRYITQLELEKLAHAS